MRNRLLVISLVLCLLFMAGPALADIIVDDGGPDDEPGQKDLNQLDFGTPGSISLPVGWNWDDTSITGANTLDACALFDTDQDGFANYVVCSEVDKDGNEITFLYQCTADSRVDRCGGPTVITTFTSACAAGIVTGSDPFRLNATHTSGNTCDTNPACYSDDTVATCTIFDADLGNPAYHKLTNVCSYPSGEPNSDPSDCVVNPDNPKLTVTKIVNNNNGGTAVISDFPLFVGSSSVVSGVQNTFPAGTYTVSETGMSGYTATIGGDCASDGSITLAAGEVKACTITNNDNAPALHLRKLVVNDNGGTAANTDWTLTAANASATALSGSTPVDSGASFVAGTYTLGESGPSGYTASDWSCSGGTQNGADITVGLGESATCTITNDDNAPGLHLRKIVTNDNGGTAANTDWTLTAANASATALSGSTPVDSGASFVAGTYTLGESGPSGYTASDWSCSGGTQDGADITVGLGESATCTITNDDNAPGLHLRKIVTNDNGGTAANTDWTLTAANASATALSGSTPVDSGASFVAGTYTLGESGPSGYTASDWSCSGGTQDGADITVGLGESATCTITNDDNAPGLHLRKIGTNDNGGTAANTDWTLTAANASATALSGSTPVDSGASFVAGTYTLGESGPSGYTASDWSCSGGTQDGADITVGLGESATCTITNDDNAPGLHLRKIVTNDNGGTAANTDWTLTAANASATALSGSTPVDSGASFVAGTYTLGESGPSGYTASDWSCSGGTQDGADITVGLGESATCTITNDDNAPGLHLRKIGTNDNGGTAANTDWTLTAANASATALSGSTPVDSGASFVAGTYTLGESGPSGYTASDWSCSGGTQDGADITVGLGESATCTITNDDNAPGLHLRKIVTNDNGGTAANTDWTLTAANASATALSGSTPVDSGASFVAGTYTLGESGPSGYTASDWSCSGGTQDGADITVGLGESATCTITNDDNAPGLHLRKIVTNDNGGTAANTDWTLTAANASATALSGSTPVDSGASFVAGTYTLGESGPSGYTASDWSCSGGTQDGADITVGLGESATCTITNDDNAPGLHLRKIVTNDNGGTAANTDWTLTAANASATALSGSTPVDSGASFVAGTYTLGESGPSGYTASDWSCSGGTQDGADITVGLGESATCTITNDDNAPGLHLRKIVTNDNGGTAANTDWTLTAANASATALSGSTPVDSGASFVAGTYTLGESGPSGYTASDWSCSGGTQDGADITVGLGESATCTITNDDNAPGLHLRKIVTNDNGGTAANTDWTLTAANASATALSGSTPVDSGASFVAGTYTLGESGPSGYTASDWSCSGGTQDGADITVGLGESATCTITNDDNAPGLHLRKIVTNDNGGTAANTDWTLTAANASATALSGSTPVDSGASFVAGTYTLGESGPSGYTASDWSCSGGTQDGADITVGLGESATCTITNDDNAPGLHLRKIVTNDNGGTAANTDWTLTAANASATALSGSTPVDSGASFVAGTYTLGESGPSGYTASDWSCSGGTQDGADITVGLGESATCTITNDDIQQGEGCTGTAGYWLNHPCTLDPVFEQCGLVLDINGVNVDTPDEARVVLDKGACAPCSKTSGKKITYYENPFNQLYRQILSAELAIHNCADNYANAADPAALGNTLNNAEDFLDSRTCSDGCSLSGPQRNWISEWNTILGQFNAGTLAGGPPECPTFPCPIDPFATQKIYIKLS